MKHPDQERISAYVDGLASEDESLELEAHVAECDECRGLLDDFRELQRAARELADRSPPEDLWPGVLSGMREGGGRDGEIIRLYPEAREPAPTARRRFSMSLPQALAAGLILAFASGALGLRMGSFTSPGTSPPALEAQAAWVSLVGSASPQLEGTAREVAELEEILLNRRHELTPGTLEIVERNLRIIDRAIEESVTALQADPENTYLRGHLQRTIEARGDYLRTAAALVTPAS